MTSGSAYTVTTSRAERVYRNITEDAEPVEYMEDMQAEQEEMTGEEYAVTKYHLAGGAGNCTTCPGPGPVRGEGGGAGQLAVSGRGASTPAGLPQTVVTGDESPSLAHPAITRTTPCHQLRTGHPRQHADTRSTTTPADATGETDYVDPPALTIRHAWVKPLGRCCFGRDLVSDFGG